MKTVKVRGWSIHKDIDRSNGVDLFVTYPEGGMGHDLITCLSCGAIYAVTIALLEYVGPDLKDKLASLSCESCGSPLRDNWAQYPEIFVFKGSRYSFQRSLVIPSDQTSEVREFPGIYEK